MKLPNKLKHSLRNREDGKDVIGITVSLSTVKKLVAWIKQKRGKT